MPRMPSEKEIIARGGKVVRAPVRLKGVGPKGGSDLEDWFLALWRETKGPAPVRQHQFAPPRKFSFDFAWPDRRVAVEIEGGQFTKRPCPQCGAMIPVGGGHQGSRFQSDVEKYNLAAAFQWRVLRFTGDDLRNAAAWVRASILSALRGIDPGDATSCQALVNALQRPKTKHNRK
jgi:very-short-patch-repair endonuclease